MFTSIIHSQIWFWIVITPIFLVIFLWFLYESLILISDIKVLYMFYIKHKVLSFKFKDEYTGNSMLAGFLNNLFSPKIWHYRDRTEKDVKPIFKD